ncbi:Clp protease [Frankia sp. AiPs1]|uniref:Clp protease N-terminal domain-containing protein n=1 Tax=Frankia sp. AiPa1 TaxID=573492 RepID=UPI002551EA2B|nr:Clp protease N-terminal domain-containing protein [Frankia sp. AiPa1]
MFERFTTSARQVVVLAQEEARGLDHNYIGTEHLLLGLLAEGDGIAAQALAEVKLSLEMTRSRIVAEVGRGKKPRNGHIPFTPRAKKTLEKSLREALALRHDYIGTEHLLLGMLAVEGGLSATLLAGWQVNTERLRARVLQLTAAASADRAAGIPSPIRTRRRRLRAGTDLSAWTDLSAEAHLVGSGASAGEPRRTVAANAGISGADDLAGGDPVGSHHLMLALLSDPDSVATRTLTDLGLDIGAARDALLHAALSGTSDELPEVAGRRGMSLRLTESAVVVEATDQRLVGLARLAFAALAGHRASASPAAGSPTAPIPADASHDGGQVPTETISGHDEIAESLSAVWTVLEASLEEIRSRALDARPRPTTADAPTSHDIASPAEG